MARPRLWEYRRGESIFAPGDASGILFYIQVGGVSLSVLSKTGQEVVVAVLGATEFFGEGCLTDEPIRSGMARALTPSVIRLVSRNKMPALLKTVHGLSDRSIAQRLSRNSRMEQTW